MFTRFRSWSGPLFCSLILGAAVFLNWPAVISNKTNRLVGSQVHQQIEGVNAAGSTQPARIILGGWPFTFTITNEFASGPPAKHFAWTNLLGNVLVFGGVLAFFWLYERRANRAGSDSIDARANVDRRANVVTTQTTKRRFSMADLILMVSLVAVCVGYWQGLTHYAKVQERTLRQRAEQGMLAVLAPQLPAWVEDRLPGWIIERFLRVREVELDNPDDDVLSYALSQKTLQRLHIGGGTYDLKLLEHLRKLPLLQDLRVSGRELTPEAIAAIASCKQLQSLNLMRTNITAKGVHALGHLPHLRSLNLIHTDVWLHELGRPPIADNLTILLLPHRDAGVADELTFEDWNELVTLQIAEYDTLANAQPTKVTLRRLPKLTQLGLDHFQNFDLTLEQVPNLKSVYAVAYQAEQRKRKLDPPPSVAWIRRLTIRGSSVADPLSINASELRTIDIQTQLPVSLKFFQNPSDSNSSDASAQEQRLRHQTVLDQLGQCSGPLSIDLSGLWLDGVDLTEFSKTKGLRSFTGSVPTADDVAKLKGQPLRELRVSSTKMSAEQVSELIATLPGLERISTARESFDRLALESHAVAEIQCLPVRQSSPADQPARDGFAHLVNLPNLRSAAIYREPLTRVHIENTPALTKLQFLHPLPTGTVIHGLEHLQCFAAGGKELRDEHFEAIKNCRNLTTLCLLYSGVSSEKLKEIGNFDKLTCLSVSGSRVTDEVLSSWKNLKGLRTLRLKQTQITEMGLRLIPKLFPALERLTIDTPIDQTTLNELVKCKNVVDLGLQRSALSVEAVAKLSNLPALIQLDLTACTLNAADAYKLQLAFFPTGSKQLVLDRVKLVQMESQGQTIEVVDPQLLELYDKPMTDKATGWSTVRITNQSTENVRFVSSRSPTIREVWLDLDEIWDGPFESAQR